MAVLVALLLGALLCQGCQWVQNEFFTLDRAAPRAPAYQGVPR